MVAAGPLFLSMDLKAFYIETKHQVNLKFSQVDPLHNLFVHFICK